MSDDHVNGIMAGARSRRFGGVLCVAALHAGAWYWMASTTPHHTLARPAAPASHVIILRFFTPLPRHAEHAAGRVVHVEAGRTIAAPPDKAAVKESRPQRVLPSEVEHGDSEQAAPAPSPVGELMAPPVIDRDNVRKVIAGLVAQERGKDIASGAILQPQDGAARKAIGQAFRPRCENGDPLKAGNVQLSGLMKLPSLMVGAVSDKGCRW